MQVEESCPQQLDKSKFRAMAEVSFPVQCNANLSYHGKSMGARTLNVRHLLLYKMNGVDISPTYNNDVKCKEFISAICESIKSDLSDMIKSSCYLECTFNMMITCDNDLLLKLRSQVGLKTTTIYCCLK